MNVAIVHPWFEKSGGAERVVDVLADMYPSADIFMLSLNPMFVPPHLRGKKIHTSPLNKVLLWCRSMRMPFMPLFPWAVEGLDVSKYDLVFSSCLPVVMGVNVSQKAVHICYCHSPWRIWWDLYAKRQATLPVPIKQMFVFAATFVRMWEFTAMQRVDHIVTNSNYIAARVFKYFRRQSTVIYPPVNTSMGYLANWHDNYYLVLSRLDAAKRIDLIIEACNRLNRRLVVAGTGEEERRLKAIAGPTIEFLGHVPDPDIPALYANCRAFVFAADEDFGIAPVEAQAFGRPVVAYGYGGSLETIRVGDRSGLSDTGVFFSEQTVESVMDGIRRFEESESKFIPVEVREHAQQFDTSVFVRRMQQFVETAMRSEGEIDPRRMVKGSMNYG